MLRSSKSPKVLDVMSAGCSSRSHGHSARKHIAKCLEDILRMTKKCNQRSTQC